MLGRKKQWKDTATKIRYIKKKHFRVLFGFVIIRDTTINFTIGKLNSVSKYKAILYVFQKLMIKKINVVPIEKYFSCWQYFCSQVKQLS